RIAKEHLFTDLRRNYEELKTEWGGDNNYERWFQKSLNNAKLNTVETYYRLVPAFHQMLRLQGGNLEKLYREAKALGALPKAKRYERLTGLLENGEDGDKSSQGYQRYRYSSLT